MNHVNCTGQSGHATTLTSPCGLLWSSGQPEAISIRNIKCSKTEADQLVSLVSRADLPAEPSFISNVE